MTKKKNRARPKPLGIHTNIDRTSPYTARARDILMAKYPKQLKDGFYHDSILQQILLTLTMDKPADHVENALRDLFSGDTIGQRISEQYFVADTQVHVTPYKKRGKKGAPKLIGRTKKSLDYDSMGAELINNFLRQSYETVFPTEQDASDFIEENLYLSDYQLEERIEDYIAANEERDDDDDEGDIRSNNGLLEIGPEPECWRSYLLASILVWKSRSTTDLQRAMEVLEDIECHLKEELDSRQSMYIQEEFREGGQGAFNGLLWHLTCTVATFCEEEIYETFLAMEDNIELHEDMVLLDFFTDVLMYLNPPRKRDEEKAFKAMRNKYKDICNGIEDDILGDFDEDNNIH